MATVVELDYTLDTDPVIPWNDQQPLSYADDECPFTLDATSPELHVQQTYLQFLWFPEQLMPLNLLVPALQRVQPGPSTSTVHPLHTLLDPLLHTTRSASTKYRNDLEHILSVGGGGGEIEEMTMWFTLNSEVSQETGEGLWLDEEWRKRYLERMERREVQIQILLYMLKLSLPGDFPPPPPPSPSKSPKKERKEMGIKKKNKGDPRQPTLVTLEAFMDKLSTWQLMAAIQLADRPLNTNEKRRDWMQTFCEDIVEPLFKESLPDQCALLRGKLFQEIPTDHDSDSPSPTTASQTDLRPFKRSRTATANPSTSRHPSPALSTTSHARRQTTSSSSSFARSRSLSVSLAQEQEEQARSRQVMDKKKRTLNREVSMSRKFKPLPMKPPPTISTKEKVKMEQEKAKAKKKEKEQGAMLVEDTPVRSASKGKKSFDVDKFRSSSKRGPLFGTAALPTIGVKSASSSSASTTVVEEDADDEVWTIKSSPHVVLLHDGLESDEDASGEDDVLGGVFDTPTKKRVSGDGNQLIPCLT